MKLATTAIPVSALEAVRDRETLFAFLHEQLGWPVDPEDTFTYQGPSVSGEMAARVEVSRLVPFTAQDPFLIMLAEFETDFRRTDLREILRAIRKEMRTRAAYQGKGLEDIIFLCATRGYQRLHFAHFREQDGRQPKLSVFGWERENIAATRTLREVNLPALCLVDEPEWTAETKRSWLSAWDVEAVTARFFIEFHTTFAEVKHRIGAESPGIAAHDLHTFTLTLMNRLLFCWFIQQKKWLAHDPAFLTHFWEQLHIDHRKKAETRGDAFYSCYLRPLFLKVLNVPPAAREPDIKQMIGEFDGNCMIPYLNGGLFEENALDRRADPDDPQREIIVPNHAIELLISEANRVQAMPGLFQRWNFTVQESTPLDMDVAVDPEMLGKVFEELMNELTAGPEDATPAGSKKKETKRHSTGAYYTPRSIVSFMCKESLKGYLGGFQELIDEGIAENITVPQARMLLDKLAKVKVVDPACGSGAYLLGMLHELSLLNRLLDTRAEQLSARDDYARKLQIIQSSLYGVDLEASAIEIARLRLWLSLVVDFDDRGDLSSIIALPNLDFKIEQGNSLSAPNPETQGSNNIFRNADVQRFSKLKSSFASPTYHGDKAAIRLEIDALREQIARGEHGNDNVQGFDWRVDFAEVFEQSEPVRTIDDRFAFVNDIDTQQTLIDQFSVLQISAGFDIVIANPPYVRQELIKDQKPKLREIYGDLYSGTADLYVFFYYRAVQLLKPEGMLVFISSNKWLRAGYGEKLRFHMAGKPEEMIGGKYSAAVPGKARVWSITDFGELPVFQTASTFPMIIVAQKGMGSIATQFTQVKSLDEPYPDVRALMAQSGRILPMESLQGANWRMSDLDTTAILRKMDVSGIPLGKYVNGQIFRGIITGFNKAFIIDNKKRDELIVIDSNSAEIIKPLAVGDNVRKWRIEDGEHWLIVTPIGIDINRFPAIFAHLSQWQQELEKRWDKGKYWWELRACDYYDAFDRPKIVYPVIGKESRFTFDQRGNFTNDKAFIIPKDDLYLLGVLNSTFAWQYLKSICSVLGDQEKGGRLELRAAHISRLPIPLAQQVDREIISVLVQKCLDARSVGCEAWEAEINERVAKLYVL